MTFLRLLPLLLAASALALGCSSESSTGMPAAFDDGGLVADGGAGQTPEGGTADASSGKDSGGGTALGGSGNFKATGWIGAPGTAPTAFSFDETVGARVALKGTQGGVTQCGDILLERKAARLTIDVVACSNAQTITISFDVPLVAGSFPADDAKIPFAQAQLWRARSGQPYVDPGAASYGTRFDNQGATLTVSNVSAKATTIDLDLKLAGMITGAMTCGTCTAGGSTLTVDLTLNLRNAPK